MITDKRKKDWVLTDMQVSALKFLDQYGAATAEELGKVVDSQSVSSVESLFYSGFDARRTVKEEGYSVGRVGAGITIWLRKRGLIRTIRYQLCVYHQITPMGRRSLRQFIELGKVLL